MATVSPNQGLCRFRVFTVFLLDKGQFECNRDFNANRREHIVNRQRNDSSKN
jgi:hypothetical protein